ncbi:MAG: hypothetical protein AVDCRST_MAG08-4578, partial [uncultured Acetobacteraceae bacterium]
PVARASGRGRRVGARRGGDRQPRRPRLLGRRLAAGPRPRRAARCHRPAGPPLGCRRESRVRPAPRAMVAAGRARAALRRLDRQRDGPPLGLGRSPLPARRSGRSARGGPSARRRCL